MKNKLSIAMSLALVMAMLVTAIVLADNLNNDVGSNGIVTITAGDSTTITYQLVGNNSPKDDPKDCDATSDNPVTVDITKDDAVTSSMTSFIFKDCGPVYKVEVTFSSDTAGEYHITHSISGGISGSKFNNNADFTLIVNTVTPTNNPPTLTLPADIMEEATSGDGAEVIFDVTAFDEEDGELTPTCEPASGSTFPLGTTQVDCSVTDDDGATTSGMFNVTVQDTTAPDVMVPADIIAEATGSDGATITFEVSASDLVDGALTPTCDYASGSTFALDTTTTITCSATDAHNNTGSDSFKVTVVDTTPPTIDSHADVGPIEATGPDGAVATYTSPATHDAVDGNGIAICTPASGGTFALGETTVTCNAKDAHNNAAAPTSFKVIVVDTTPPTLILPANMTVPATSPAGAVVTFSASADDLVDGSVPVICSPASDSTFVPGITIVNCSATDAHGNTASGSFIVWVKYQLLGFYQPVDMNGVWNTVKGGSTVPFKFEVFAGSTELTDISVVSSFVATSVACPVSGMIADVIEFTTTGGTSLRYDWTEGQFINNWQTPKRPGACYVVTMTTKDGSSLSANFKLK